MPQHFLKHKTIKNQIRGMKNLLFKIILLAKEKIIHKIIHKDFYTNLSFPFNFLKIKEN